MLNEYEYDYINGRSVPGDGRIDFDKAFPPAFVPHTRFSLSSAHAKQMCWEESGGSWGTVYSEVVKQAEEYLKQTKLKKISLADQIDTTTALEEVADKRKGRRRVFTNLVSRARNAKRNIWKRRLAKRALTDDNDSGGGVVVTVRQRRFTFRRRR
eukprot:g3787.t1 g3787   contig13:160472-160936(+)